MKQFRVVFLSVFMAFVLNIHAQHGIGTNDANPSAMLDIVSSDKGVLFPSVNLTSSNTLSPITGTASDSHNGMIVYNTNPTIGSGLSGIGYYFWTGGATGNWNFVVSNHSSPTTGQFLSWNGTSWQSNTATTAQNFYPIWAEESGALNNNAFEWSYGNGDEAPITQGIPIPVSGELFAVGVSLVGATSSTINVLINGAVVATTNPYTGTGSAITTLLTPVRVSPGDLINFQTSIAGGANEGKVVAWFSKSSAVQFNIIDLLDVNHADVIPSTNDVLQWNGNDWGIHTPNTNNPNIFNDIPDVDTVTNSPNVNDFLQWNGSRWVPVPNTVINDLNASASISNATTLNFNANTAFTDRALATINFNEFTLTDVTPDGTGFTINTAGTYYITYGGVFNATGQRNTIVTQIDAGGNLGGQDFIYIRNFSGINQGAASGSYTTRLNAGDTVRLQSRREGSITNAVNTDAIGIVNMSITRIK